MDNISRPNNEKNREDAIKQARESCYRNLSPAAKKSNIKVNKSKSTYNKPKKTIVKKMGKPIIAIKPFLIRVLCAFAIFVTIITIASLDTKYDTNHSDAIETIITDNTSIEENEDFFVGILEKIRK